MTINTLIKEMEPEEVKTNSNSDSDRESDDFENENSGWADSIAKILKTNKPKGKKTLVLSKGKKICETVSKKTGKVDFEIQTVNNEIKLGSDDTEKLEKNKEVNKVHVRKKRKELPVFRVKPNVLNKNRERILSKIATKGVVQLFNAIKSQQTDINNKLEEAGSLDIKRNKVLKNIDKRAFLDILMGERSETVITKEKIENRNEKVEKHWNVLRDDFMMGAKLKDWDKELEEEKEMEYE